MSGFGDYAMGGIRPRGGKPSFPLLSREEWTFLNIPYNRWAPAPYNILSYSCYDRLMPLVTGQNLDELGYSPRVDVPARLRPLKAKLQLGMAPISHDRWLERKMDEPANYRNLFELMKDVIKLFQWFNNDQVIRVTRDSFNWMVDRHVEFERAANLRREQSGISERLNMAGMWAEYWSDTWTTMSDKTHRWFVDRVDEVSSRAFAEYNVAIIAAWGDEAKIGEAGKKYYECVQDLRALITSIDYTIGIPMTGFKGYSDTGDITDLSISERQDMYRDIMSSMPFEHQAAILDAQDKAEAEERANPPSFAEQMDIMGQLTKPAHPRFRDTKNLLGHYEEGKRNRDETRMTLRGEPELPEQEHWITILRERMDWYLQNNYRTEEDRKMHKWGFVLYRLTYDESEEEWASFMEKFTKDISRSGQWIAGADKIIERAGVTLIDGRDHGIPEGDIEAAKRHFKTTYTMLPTLGRMWTQDFLVVDKQSYRSYTEPLKEEIRPPPPYGPGFGCNGGHVRLVDTTFDQLPKDMLDSQSPGYKGQMKVLSTLVFEELYPLLATLSVRPFGLWPAARLHPREVYVGATDASQEGWWEFNRIDQVAAMRFFDDMRQKKAALVARRAAGEGSGS